MSVPYEGKTAMREAFENIVPPKERSRTVGKIIRSLRSPRGTFKAKGWRVFRAKRRKR